jgi:Lon protease-like protein
MAEKQDLKFHESFDCPLCSNLLYQPITTSCGHTFCKACLLRVMDHDNKCPMCRAVFHITPEYGVSVVLHELIKQLLPEQYQKRKEEVEKELLEQQFNLPLFLLGDLVLFPGMSLPLHVFEPRYRLMIRRCLEGGRRFGILPSQSQDLGKIGCTAVIENHYVFPDGRNLIATMGSKRFKVLETWNQDGYACAKVQYFEDDPLITEMEAKIPDLFKSIKEKFSSKFASHVSAIEEKYGSSPTDPNLFVWWVLSFLPLSFDKRMAMLESTSPVDRLKMLDEELDKTSMGDDI